MLSATMQPKAPTPQPPLLHAKYVADQSKSATSPSCDNIPIGIGTGAARCHHQQPQTVSAPEADVHQCNHGASIRRYLYTLGASAMHAPGDVPGSSAGLRVFL